MTDKKDLIPSKGINPVLASALGVNPVDEFPWQRLKDFENQLERTRGLVSIALQTMEILASELVLMKELGDPIVAAGRMDSTIRFGQYCGLGDAVVDFIRAYDVVMHDKDYGSDAVVRDGFKKLGWRS